MDSFKPICVVLKEARNNKGISLEEVYKATKIHPNILRSLEEGTTLQLSAVYVKSYIKIYAKYLGISREELDKYFHPAPLIKKKEKSISSDILLKLRKTRISKLPKLFSLSDLSYNLSFWAKKYKNIIGVFVVILVLLFFIKNAGNARKVTETLTDVQKTKSLDIAQKKQETKKPSLPNVQDDLRLTIFAEQDTWMQVKVDGSVVFKRILKKFSSETWQAKRGFELRISDAGAVKLELNGKILSPIGRKGQSLKKVLITRKGLSVKR